MAEDVKTPNDTAGVQTGDIRQLEVREPSSTESQFKAVPVSSGGKRVEAEADERARAERKHKMVEEAINIASNPGDRWQTREH